MQAHVGKSEKAKHAAEADEIRNIEQLAQWCDGQGEQQEAECPIAGEMLDIFDGIGGELAVIGTQAEIAEGRKAKKEDQDF
jgi:hypothetical protein